MDKETIFNSVDKRQKTKQDIADTFKEPQWQKDVKASIGGLFGMSGKQDAMKEAIKRKMGK